MPRPKRSKYGNVRVERNGEKYDSILEADYHDVLKIRRGAGEFIAIQRQVPFGLHVNGIKLGTYKADYVVTSPGGGEAVHECKGFDTALWLWKKKHFEAEYPDWDLLIVRSIR